MLGKKDPAAGSAVSWGRLWRSDTWVRPFFARYRSVLVLSLALGALAGACACGLMGVSGYLISASAEKPLEGVFSLFVPLALVQVFGIAKPFVGYLERLCSHDWVLRMTSSLRVRLYRVAERDALVWRGLRRTGDVLGLLAQDIGHVQDLYLRVVFPTVVALVLWLGASLVLGFFSPLFGLVFLLVLGVVCVLAPLVSVLVNGARQMRRDALQASLYAAVTDDVLGVGDWACAGRGDDYVRRVAEAQEALDRVEAAMARFDRRRDLAVQLVLGAAAVLVLVWAAGRFGAAPNAADAGMGLVGRPADWIAAVVLGYFPLMEVLAPLSKAAEEAGGYRGSVERLNALGDPGAGVGEDAGPATPGEVLESVLGLEPSGVRAGRDAREAVAEGEPAGPRVVVGQEAAADREPAAGAGAAGAGGPKAAPASVPPRIELQGVRFSYAGEDRAVLDGLDLVVEPGQKLAVLGPSGAGKSTLLGLVRGDLVPDEGSVRLGSAVPSELGDGVASLVGMIQQDTYLFNDTLLENLRVGNPDATEAQAAAALEAVGLGGLLGRLPQGLNTLVAEAGLGFSGGERHRVALARVLLQNAPVVLLDEPTVGLDPETERALLRTVFEVLDGRTLVMVTHHLLGVGAMDRVAFVEGGRVALEGTPAELEAASERYRRLLAFDRGV